MDLKSRYPKKPLMQSQTIQSLTSELMGMARRNLLELWLVLGIMLVLERSDHARIQSRLHNKGR